MMILDKLVALRCRDPVLLERLCELARIDEYTPIVAEVERCVAGGLPDTAQSIAVWLYERLRAGGLIDVFRDGPKPSEVQREDILTLAKFSDVRPDSKTMFQATDPVFMRLVSLSKQGPVEVDKLIFDDFCQLAIIAVNFSQLWDDLHNLAQATADWTDNMLAVELFLSQGKPLPTHPLAASFAQSAATASFPDGTALTSMMLAPPRFSAMLAEEVLAYNIVRPQLPAPNSLINKQYTPSPSPVETGRALAERALGGLQIQTKARIERCYELRLGPLRELTQRRIFVKRDILEHLQPTLFDRMQRDFVGFLQFEKQILRPDTCTEEELFRLRPYLHDERLVRVLSLQPYFGHLMDPVPTGPAVSLVESSYVAPHPSSPATPSSVRPPLQPAFAEQSVATAAGLAQISAAQSTPPFMELSEVTYDDVYLSLERSTDPTITSYRAELRNATTQRSATHDGITLNWDEIHHRLQRLRFAQNVPQSRNIVVPQTNLADELKQLGLFVYDSIFKGLLRDELLSMLSSTRNLRLHWLGDPTEPATSVLPWECLFVPSAPVSFLALTRKYSLTRRYETKSMPVSAIGQKVRILFVAASPEGVAPLPGIQQELTTMRKVIGSSGRATLEVIEKATVAEVQPMLREFRPHVFHFSGHGAYQPEATAGTLIFQTSAGSPHLVTADQLALMLYENDVSLALLNGCDTGVSSMNDALSSVAGALVKAGVPAVVATMREVWDEAAARFSREFYRSFLAGFTVEGCVGEARKALSLDNWDWSPYALFVGSAELNKLRVSGPARSPGEFTASAPNSALR